MVNNRIRNIAPAIPFIFLHGTDEQVITDVATPITWSHSHFITSDFKFIATGTRIIINKTFKGRVYRVFVQVGATKKAGAPSYIELKIYINGVAQPCCLTHGAIGSLGNHGDAILGSAVYANAGDYIEVYARVDAGSATVEADTARIIIEGLPMMGWDNGAGGSKIQNTPRGG